MADSAWVYMTNGKTGGRQRVTRKAFDGLWSDKGWIIDEEAPDSAAFVPAETTVTAPDYSSLRKEQLVEVAEARGIDPQGLNKDELIARLEQG